MKKNETGRETSSNQQAIGVIDSGVGGLTVAKELIRQLPKENIIYLGDTLRCPYGPRTKKEVLTYTWEMVNFLLKKNIKSLVVACNTATAFTLTNLQENLHIPVIGVIQAGARAAITATSTSVIGVIGTEGTIRSNAYINALQGIKPRIQTKSLACPTFVPLVERGRLHGEEAFTIVNKALQPMNRLSEMDTLILGCTHYPLLQQTIQKAIGQNVKLISSSDETARETSTILDVQNLLCKENRTPRYDFFTTGDVTIFQSILTKIFTSLEINQQKITVQNVRIN